MQSILSVDLSTNTAEILLLESSGTAIRPISHHSVEIGDFLYEYLLINSKGAGNLSNGTGEKGSESDEEGVYQSQPEGIKAGYINGIPSVKEKLKELGNAWQSAVVIIPPYENISFNLSLPFSESKQINRIIDLEVQDSVPVETSKFLVHHQIVGQMSESVSDIHISMAPKAYIRAILDLLKDTGIEPSVICTPSAAVGGLYSLIPELKEKNSAVFYAHGRNYAVTVSIDGRIRGDRTFNTDGLRSSGMTIDEIRQEIISQTIITLSSFEKRYGKKIEVIYLVGDAYDPHSLVFSLGRSVRKISSDEIGSESELAVLGGVFGEDSPPSPILTNFRVREFSYKPHYRELFSAFNSLLIYFALLLGVFGVYITVKYYIGEFKIASLTSSVGTQIISSFSKEELSSETLAGRSAEEMVQLAQKKSVELENQLKDLVPPSSLSPLDYLLEISKTFPSANDISVRKISIRGKSVSLEGSAPNYSSLESIERTLKKKRGVFCKVDNTGGHSGAGGSLREFKFDIRMCE